MKLQAGVTDGALYQDGHFVGRLNTTEKAKEIADSVNATAALLEAAKRAKRFLLNGAPADGDPTIGMRSDEVALYQTLKDAIAEAEKVRP